MQVILLLIGGFLLSVLFGLMIIPRILVISHKKKLYDLPDERKVHTSPIPRLGGLSFFPAIQMSFLLSIGIQFLLFGLDSDIFEFKMLSDFTFLLVGMTLLYLVGVCDDLIGVGYRYKFLLQIISALLLVLSGNFFTSLGGLCGFYAISPWLGIPITIILMVYITNAINLIDGIDGLASGLCCLTLIILSIIFYNLNDYIYTLLSCCTLGILLPFWSYNVFGNAQKGKKLFMGDAGSLTLGYVISFLLIHLCISNQKSDNSDNPYFMIGFSTVLVPLLDVVRVVLHRIREKKNPFLPDKNHFHHKLLRTGMRVRMVMISIIVIAVFFILLNLILTYLTINNTFILFIDLVLWTSLHLFLNKIIIARESNVRE